MVGQWKKRLGSVVLTLLFVCLLSVAAMAAVPGRVTRVKAAVGESQVTLSWKALKTAKRYRIYGAKSGEKLKRVTATNKTTVTIRNLANGVSYDFAIAAFNASGFGAKSKTITVTPQLSKPGKVQNLKAYEGNRTISLRWTAGAKATSYRVYYKRTSASKWKKATETKRNSATISNLANGTSYKVAVMSVRTVGKKVLTSGMKILSAVTPSKDGFGSVHSVLYSATVTKATLLRGLYTTGTKRVTAGTSLTISRTATNGYYEALYQNSYWLVPQDAVTKTGMVSQKGAYSSSKATKYVNGQKWTSNTNYLIWVSVYAQTMFIFQKQNGSWALIRKWYCGTGKWETQSVYGKTRIYGKSEVWYFEGDIGGYWASTIAGGAIHSGGGLGTPVSHGCVRVDLSNAKWIYDTIPVGTAVYIF